MAVRHAEKVEQQENNKNQNKTKIVVDVIVRALKIAIASKMQTSDLFGSGTLSMHLFEITNHLNPDRRIESRSTFQHTMMPQKKRAAVGRGHANHMLAVVLVEQIGQSELEEHSHKSRSSCCHHSRDL